MIAETPKNPTPEPAANYRLNLFPNAREYLLHGFRRIRATSVPVGQIGYFPRKKHPAYHDRLGHLAFSFIISGSGSLTFKNTTRAFAAPAVICQPPGFTFHHGPDQTWEELYFTYAAEHAESALKRIGVSPAREPFFWAIRNISMVNATIDKMLPLLNSPACPGFIDMIDLLAELCLVESLYGVSEAEEKTELSEVTRIAEFLRERYAGRIDMRKVLKDHGFSVSTFRRYWAQRFSISPTRFVLSLRMHEACRLLAETALTVKEIAERTGFESQEYFARTFRREENISPSEYRRRRMALRQS